MMTMEQFQEEKSRLMAIHGGTGRASANKRAQSFAKLYAQSEWTERALAENEGLSNSRVHQLLLFGRFLIWMLTQGEQDIDPHEKPFRFAWRHTDKTRNEDERFTSAKELLLENTTDKPATKVLTKKLIAQFSDGKYHRVSDMADAIEADIAAVRSICDRIVTQGTFQIFGERRPAPPKEGSYAYRFVKGGKKKIDLTAFYAEVKPVLDEMENVINGHSVHFSQQLMKVTFAQFRQVIDRVAR